MIHTNDLLAKDIIPDALIRAGIRHRLAGTLAPFEKLDCEQRQQKVMQHLSGLRTSPLAIATDEANEQHYELPTRFFDAITADLAHRLARIYRPALEQARKMDRDEAWSIASTEDTEWVPMYVSPGLSGYWRR